MENFINEYLGSFIALAAILLIAIVLLFVAKGRYRKVAKQILLSLVVTAEKVFGGKTGEIKFSYVAERLYAVMPAIIRVIFSEKDIANMIEEAVDKMKEYISDIPEESPTNAAAPNEEYLPEEN